MEDLVVLISILVVVYVGWFIDYPVMRNKGKTVVFGALVLVGLVFMATMPNFTPTYAYIMLIGIISYIILTVSWTLFSGPTGYISLAPAAFYGVGIYTSAILSNHFPVVVTVIFGGLLSFVLAAIVGAITLRLKGIYFIIFTFGLVLLISSLLLWYEIKFTGTRGRFIMGTDNLTIYYIMLAIMVLLFIFSFFLKRSKFGLALQSIGQNEEAAAHLGINVTAVKIVVFSLSAIFMGMAGSILAMKLTYLDPQSAFDPFRSFMPVLMAIFGGMKKSYGPVVGASILAYLEEKLLTEFPYYYKLSFGIVLVLVILYLPDGLVGVVEKTRAWISRGKHALT